MSVSRIVVSIGTVETGRLVAELSVPYEKAGVFITWLQRLNRAHDLMERKGTPWNARIGVPGADAPDGMHAGPDTRQLLEEFVANTSTGEFHRQIGMLDAVILALTAGRT